MMMHSQYAGKDYIRQTHGGSPVLQRPLRYLQSMPQLLNDFSSGVRVYRAWTLMRAYQTPNL